MMKKVIKIVFCLLIPSVTVVSCSNHHSQSAAATTQATPPDTAKKHIADTVKPIEKTVQMRAPDTVTPDRRYNDIARYIAGMKQEPGSTLSPKLEKDTVWIRYAKNFETEWQQAERVRLRPMAQWANAELAAQHKRNLDVFYPFSGPDILHANVLFPQAKHYYLYGLERAGGLPDFKHMKTADIDDYLAATYTSLSDILVKSYFITKDMLTDLQKEKVNGTLPLMCIFLVRNDCEIINVKYFHLDDDGREVQLNKDSLPVHGNDFVKVYFKHNHDTMVQVVSYIKCDLSDEGLKRNKGLTAWLDNMPMSLTYLKSASYLLHDPHFVVMRNLILQKSRSILQDDTGIPYRYFDKNWTVTLYGVYTQPVTSFSQGLFQPDLKKAYRAADSLKQLKKLPFSLGYHWGSHLQNLLKAERKN